LTPLLVAAFGVVLLWPQVADAQRRGFRSAPHVVRSVVVFGGYGYPRPFYSGFYDPWFQWGPYPYPYPPYGYGYMRDELTSSVKLEVSPRDAEVFVDGYRAGVVDDFDGTFQRLRLRPGAHEIVVYLEGYRTIRESLYLSSGSDRKIQRSMDRLAAGQTADPPPPPITDRPDDDPARQPPGAAAAPRRPGPADPREPAGPPPGVEAPRTFGTLAIRVQPADAEVFIDGERWNAPAGQDGISIRLSEGRHRVEIRKAGFNTYAEDVLIRRGATLPINVSLLRGN
jgi:hypothetical protein